MTTFDVRLVAFHRRRSYGTFSQMRPWIRDFIVREMFLPVWSGRLKLASRDLCTLERQEISWTRFPCFLFFLFFFFLLTFSYWSSPPSVADTLLVNAVLLFDFTGIYWISFREKMPYAHTPRRLIESSSTRTSTCTWRSSRTFIHVTLRILFRSRTSHARSTEEI